MSARSIWFRNAVLAAVLVIVSVVLTFARKEFQPPRVSPAATYPARDAHPKENVTVAADPYDTAEKLKLFRLKYLEHGILPVNLIVTNDGGAPIALTGIKIQLTTSNNRARLSPMDPDDVYRRLEVVKRSEDVARPPIVNVPIPRKKKLSKLSLDDKDEVIQARFQAAAVEPNSTQAGFAFFDISGLEYPLPDAMLYITGARDSEGNDLMFFEIPLEKVMAH